MKFLADESVERLVVAMLREEGHDVVYVAEGAPGLDDASGLAAANDELRVLVTNDKDFGELVFRNGLASAGIVLVRLGRERTAPKVESVRELVRTHLELLPGHFTVLGESRVRRRPLRPSTA